MIDLTPIQLVLGPGGAGVSVVAAAAAVDKRDRGDRPSPLLDAGPRGPLLITLDPSSPVPGMVGVYPSPGVPVPISADASLLSLSPLGVLEPAWAAFVEAVGGMTSGPTLPVVSVLASVAPGELSSLPGFEELLLWRRIRDEATSGRWSAIIVDCSGLGDPFALLRAPATLSQAVNRLWPRHRRLAAAAERPVLARASAAVDEVDRDCRDVVDLLRDPHTTAAHLVVDPGERGLRLLPRFAALAALTALPLRGVYGNEGTAPRPDAEFDDAASAVAQGFGAAVVRVPAVDGPLDRVARLRRLQIRFDDPSGTPVGTAAAVVERVEGSGVDAVYELSWPQPLPEPTALGLGRAGDDLLVTISGFRFPVRLPPVLRRCVVVGANWTGGHLRVRFTPDPAVWPQRPTA